MGKCARCGADLSRATEGLCSRCLMAQGLSIGSLPGVPFPGRAIGDYDLLEEIARGGMGVVFKARQRSLDRVVALKTLLFGRHAEPEAVRRFRAEATVAASLRHPGIVAIHEVGVYQDEHYLVMDLVDGPSLAQFVKGVPLAPNRAASYMRDIALAVHYAHERGVLHRDLKPSNVLIDSSDQPRITDFGLAKRISIDSSLTLSGHLMGSPGYMPPEQASGGRGKLNRSSDVYALGATLYHVLTGRPPFVGGSLSHTLDQVLHRDPVSPRLLISAIPPDLETICLKCLEKEQSRRYQTAQELARELERFLCGEPTIARPLGAAGNIWRWCRRRPAVASLMAVVCFISVLGGAGVLWQWRRAERHAGNEIRQRQRAEAEAHRAGQYSYAASMQVAQLAIEQGDLARAREHLSRYVPSGTNEDQRGFEWRYSWHRSHGDQTATIPLAAEGFGDLRHLAVSSDGRWLAAGRDVFDGTSDRFPRQFMLEVGEAALAFAPNSHVLLIVGPAGLKHRNLASGELGVLDAAETNIVACGFSPGGTWLATASKFGLRLYETTGWTIVSERPEVRFTRFFGAKGLAFSPNETTLITAAGNSRQSLSRLQAWKVPSLDPLPFSANDSTDTAAIAFSPDGQEFATGAYDGTVHLWDADIRKELPMRQSLNHHRSLITDMAYLPGGRQLVTASLDRCLRLWGTEPAEPPVTLRGHGQELRAISLTADGTIFSVSRDGIIKKWSPGVEMDRKLPGAGKNLIPVGLSADGSTVVTLGGGILQFWDVASRVCRELPRQRWEMEAFNQMRFDSDRLSQAISISPDFKWLALVREHGLAQLWNVTERTMRDVSARDGSVAWAIFSPDSQWLVLPGSNNTASVWNTAGPRQVASLPAPLTEQHISFAATVPILAVSLADEVILWNLETNVRVRRLKIKMGLAMALSPDGSLIVTGNTDGAVRVYDRTTGREVVSLGGHFSGIERVCFSPDSRTLVSASRQLVKFWNVTTWSEIGSYRQTARVLVLSFSQDGSTLLASDGAGRFIEIWRAPFLAAEDLRLHDRHAER